MTCPYSPKLGSSLDVSASSTASILAPSAQALAPLNIASSVIYLVPVPLLQLQAVQMPQLLTPAVPAVSSAEALGSEDKRKSPVLGE